MCQLCWTSYNLDLWEPPALLPSSCPVSLRPSAALLFGRAGNIFTECGLLQRASCLPTELTVPRVVGRVCTEAGRAALAEVEASR